MASRVQNQSAPQPSSRAERTPPTQPKAPCARRGRGRDPNATCGNPLALRASDQDDVGCASAAPTGAFARVKTAMHVFSTFRFFLSQKRTQWVPNAWICTLLQLLDWYVAQAQSKSCKSVQTTPISALTGHHHGRNNLKAAKMCMGAYIERRVFCDRLRMRQYSAPRIPLQYAAGIRGAGFASRNETANTHGRPPWGINRVEQ